MQYKKRNAHKMFNVFLFTLCVAGVRGVEEVPRTMTANGELIGTTYQTYSGREVKAFYRVPFAKPPINELRFEPPQPVESWSEPRDATEKGDFCVQPQLPLILLSAGSEDCLHLDVYTPSIPQNGTCERYLPIMFYLHSSAWFYSSGTVMEPYYIMDEHDVIFVPINYRLGLLGYLSTGDMVVPGNNGQKDQVMALKWLKQNARAFCGDPDQITIGGSSAGSISAGLHTMSPLSRGLFKNIVSISGSPYMSVTYRPFVVEFGKIIADQMGCPNDDSRRMVDCLRTKDPYLFWNFDFQFRPFLLTPVVNFGIVLEPCHEGAYLTKLPEEYIANGEVDDVPILSFDSEFEGLVYVFLIAIPGVTPLIDLTYKNTFRFIYDYNSTSPFNELVEIAESIKKEYFTEGLGLVTLNENKFIQSLTDRLFATAKYNYVMDMARISKSNVYSVEYAYRGQVSSTSLLSLSFSNVDYGAGHTDGELLAFFNSLFDKKFRLNPNDTEMMRFLTHFYYTFMVDGKPSVADELGWESVPRSGDEITYLRINNAHDMEMKRCDNFGNHKFWDNIPYLPNRGFPYADTCKKTHINYHKG